MPYPFYGTGSIGESGNTLTVTGINTPRVSISKNKKSNKTSGSIADKLTVTGHSGNSNNTTQTRSIVDPFATDSNYSTTPTGLGPHKPYTAGGKTYYKTAGGNPTITADLHDAYTGYTGAVNTGYNQTVPSYTGSYEKGSKFQRADENIYQQNILDELTKYATSLGFGDFTKSDAGTPQWMPTSDRNQDNRLTEDIWQQGQISDLEAWASSIVGSDKYSGLSFNPSEVFGDMSSKHTNKGMERNLAQSTSIDSLIDFISNLDTARGPEIDREKSTLTGIYGAEIDNLYNTLFETDTGIDPAGKAYWTKDLIENRPNLTEGQNWQNWLKDAFKNTDSYKDFLINKGPKTIDPTVKIDETVDPVISTSTALTNYSTQLQNEKDSWDIRFNDLTSMYTDQINDLKATFEQSNRDQAALFKGYQDQVAGYREDLNAQAAYGERPMNQSVKGVKTRNELPGFKPSTGGTTGHFNRSGNRITNSSLNIA